MMPRPWWGHWPFKLILAACLFCSVGGCRRNESKDVQKQRILFGSHEFDVPVAYLGGRRPTERPVRADSLLIQTMLPDLRPATYADQSNPSDYVNLVSILIMFKGPQLSDEQLVQHLLKSQTRPREPKEDLLSYVETHVYTNQDFYYRQDGVQPTSISCLDFDGPPAVSSLCETSDAIDKAEYPLWDHIRYGLVASATFDRRYLQSAVVIDQKVRQLVMLWRSVAQRQQSG